jgi:hypothetical protein
MARKIAERSTNSRLHVICPFCGYEVTWLTEMTWCANCYVEFTVRRDEEGDLVVTFDDKKRTDRFALAKALAKAGGVRFGPEEAD